ncbi:hypothetical protein [Mesorhizobium sp.]|uniref:hypothetical protein n=1 Tax=Mesorhizobium sp. TaxID=1871066 RepID=UPI000FE4701C|nr:hypothetical protein [Mesorhizobium sp.]RWA98305.1 MAG: hypothetical protein EOQ33_27700 [Mesorhizobium sp.]
MAADVTIPEAFLGEWQWNPAECNQQNAMGDEDSGWVWISSPNPDLPRGKIEIMPVGSGEPMMCEPIRIEVDGARLQVTAACPFEEAPAQETKLFFALQKDGARLSLAQTADDKRPVLFNSCQKANKQVGAASQATAGESCTSHDAVWSHESRGSTWRYYTTGSAWTMRDAFIEKWTGQKLDYRIKGEWTCSNGAVICQVIMPTKPLDSPTDAADGTVNAVFEEIDENGDRVPEWVVLAGLGQAYYYSAGPRYDFVNGDEPPHRSYIPNVFKYETCNRDVGDEWLGRWGLDEKACEHSFDARRNAVVEFTVPNYFEKDHTCEMFSNESLINGKKITLKCFLGDKPYFPVKMMQMDGNKATITTTGDITRPDDIETRIKCAG